ncbi:helix-turn-helix domain-containing protein, partial [Candidatus Gracilibacteria bacterium]|nr:helix-turn-helix domain-containing protein [Candidatus Gracilibacteria bacterium]
IDPHSSRSPRGSTGRGSASTSDSHISRIDLVGKDAIVIKDGLQVTEFREGLLPWALQRPVGLVFDPGLARAEEWAIVGRVRAHPALGQLPLMLVEGDGISPAAPAVGVARKPMREQDLVRTLPLLKPQAGNAPVLVVDDDLAARELFVRVVRATFPDRDILIAADGQAALALIAHHVPALVILDLSMPEVDGFAVLAALRTTPATAHVPVLVLSGAVLTDAELRQLNHLRVTFQSKNILDDDELAASMRQLLVGVDRPAQQTSALVRRAVAYLQNHYARLLTRDEVAAAIGVHKDYLSRIFQQELGISPWEYLLRYRVKQARQLLRSTAAPITAIASQVGFEDSAYFSRVFRKHTGCSPRDYREQPEPGSEQPGTRPPLNPGLAA